jgi:hypothetical protein
LSSSTYTSFIENSIEAGNLLCGNGALHAMLAALALPGLSRSLSRCHNNSVSDCPSPVASVPTSLPCYTLYSDSQLPVYQCSYYAKKQIQSRSVCPCITRRCRFALLELPSVFVLAADFHHNNRNHSTCSAHLLAPLQMRFSLRSGPIGLNKICCSHARISA